MNADTTRQEIAYQVHVAVTVSRFVEDSDAIAAMRKNFGGATPWRVQVLALGAFQDWVERKRDRGFLLYLHDGCSLFHPMPKGGAA